MAGPEKKFEKRLREMLESSGAYVRKLHGGQFMRDMPDLLVGYGGRMFMIEVKDTGASRTLESGALIARMSPGQMYESKQWTAKGCEYWIVGGRASADRAYAYRLRSGVAMIKPTTIEDAAEKILDGGATQDEDEEKDEG